MKHRIFSFLLSLVLLVSAQTASAAALVSAAAAISDFTTLAQWSTATTCGGTVAAPTAITAGTDTFTICNGHTLTLAANATNVGGVTVAAGGKLVLGSYTLTLASGGSVTNNTTTSEISMTNTGGVPGIIISGAGSYTGTNGILKSICQSAAGGGGFGTAATWSITSGSNTGSCGVAETTLSAAPTAYSDVIISGSVATPTMTAAVTLSGSSTASAKSVTIAAGGKLNHTSSSALTIKGNLTNNATAAGDVVLGPVTFDSTAATVGGSQTTTFTGLLTVTGTGGALTLAGSTILNGGFTLTSPGTITLASTNTVGGNVTTYGSAISGVLKFGAGNKTITASDTSVVIPAVDVSAMSAAQRITVGTTNGIKFTNVLGGTLTTSAPAAYVFGATIAATDYVTVTPTPAVSAPIFSSKEKAKVFVEEVNH